MFIYRVAKENAVNGQQSKRTRIIHRNRPLAVGGLYVHLGYGFRGTYRVLEEMKGEEEL